MKILLLAPHPFYQERGTPIAVDLLVSALSERGDQVDILTFHEGRDREYPNVVISRINPVLNINGISPGFSFKKIFCDLALLFKLINMLQKKQYDLIHAVEESATLAMFCKIFYKTPYVYDMDSIISEQLLEKNALFRLVVPIVRFFEKQTIKHSQATVAVCQAIADYADHYKAENVYLLKDISLISDRDISANIDNLRAYTTQDKKIGLYIGNLEPYQGIDLLMESIALYNSHNTDICLIVIGGNPDDIDHYSDKSRQLGVTESIHFLGPRPIQDMAAYMAQADFLFSPRISGTNTPMKIYSYLASGVPVIATALPTHTQVMNEDIAFLAKANTKDFTRVIHELINNPILATKKSSKAKEFIQDEHSLEVFKCRVNMIYDKLKLSLSH